MQLDYITVLLGEYAASEIDDVEKIIYPIDIEASGFIIVLTNGKQFAVDVKEKPPV